jgi:hypothetical protein
MAQPAGRAQAWMYLLAAGAMVAFTGSGCGTKSRPEDRARVDACVLTGATTNDGCDVSAGGGAEIKLGDLTMGALKTRDVALFNGGAGQVAATISDVRLDAGGGSTANYAILKFFKLDATSAEVAVTLPYDLAVNHGSELRVRVAFTANAAIGAVSGVSVKVVASHPAVSVVIPITGQITGCPTGKGDCDNDPSNGCEADLQATLANCGACGTACGETNATAACVAGTCQITCAAGFGNCDGDAANGCETDLSATPAHCGSCGQACDSGNGTASCTTGTCGIACNAGFADCDGDPANGCEVTLATDASHCGACGTVCSANNGAPTCSNGLCVTACDAGFANCDGSAANGCEVQLASDPAHCGACGTACNSTNGTATCSASTCGITCNAGFGNCDGNATNGCEVNLSADPAHCGGCGTVCNSTNGTATCTASTCGISCGAGFGNCDGNAANGCEVTLASDLLHCGSCGTACGTANAVAACSAGACSLACLPGYADCDGLNADGCETSVVLDVNNCGGCGLACAAPNGTPGCAAGTCVVAACNAGQADCNGQVSDGCEVDVTSDVNNCGACGNVCSAANGTASCVAGACAVAACSGGWADCDANPSNGCETSIATSATDCGVCGNVCGVPANGSAACSGGTCGLGACNSGYADCNGLLADGCEKNVSADPANCGACGNVCNLPNATSACSLGNCAVAACSAGHYDMDGVAADGCECAADGFSGSCAAATVLGTMNLGQTTVVSGSLVPNLKEDWFKVAFASNLSASYHPKIALTSATGVLKFDVLSNCTGTAAGGCGAEGGLSTARTTWETYYTGGDTSNYYGNFQPIPPPGVGGVVLVRVYATVSTGTCGTFTLTVSN